MALAVLNCNQLPVASYEEQVFDVFDAGVMQVEVLLCTSSMVRTAAAASFSVYCPCDVTMSTCNSTSSGSGADAGQVRAHVLMLAEQR
jgi:hypothetical protein